MYFLLKKNLGSKIRALFFLLIILIQVSSRGAFQENCYDFKETAVPPGGLLGLIFAGQAAGLSEPLPRYSLFCGQLQTPYQSLLGKYVIFAIPTQSLSIYGTFANRKYEQLSYPKNPKMCDTILLTLLKMQPYYSQSSRENATPSSGTSPLAPYKEVPRAAPKQA